MSAYVLISKIVNIILALIALSLAIFVARDWWLAGLIFALVLFIEILRYLAGKSARKNISKLENLARSLTKYSIHEGDTVLVRGGERIPADGVVAEGETLCNEFPLTGSPLQILKRKGSPVYATAINEGGDINILVRDFGDHTVIAKMARAVRALWRLAPGIEKKALMAELGIFIFIAVVTGVARYSLFGNLNMIISLFLVTSLGASAFLIHQLWRVNASQAALRGIIFKSASAFENLGKCCFISFNLNSDPAHSDKNFSYMRVFWGVADNEVLALAASAEKFSNHPLAGAILAEAHRKNIKYQNPDAFSIIKGGGVLADQGGKKIAIGSEKFILENNIHIQDEIQKHISRELEQGTEIAIVALDKKIIGVFSFGDVKKEELKLLASQLKVLGVSEAGADDTAKTMISVRSATDEASESAGGNINMAFGVLDAGVFPKKYDILIMYNILGVLPKLIAFSRESSVMAKKFLIFSVGLNVIGIALVFLKILDPYGAVSFHIFIELVALILAIRLFKKSDILL